MKTQIAFILAMLLCLANLAMGQEVAAVMEQPAESLQSTVEKTTETQEEAESLFVPTVAVLTFESRSRQAENEKAGKSMSELLFVQLLENGCVDLVERAELDKALDELHLSATGMTSKESQVKLGQLIGAKILITGSVFESGKKHFAVAKIIGTETSRVKGCSVSGTGDYLDLVPELAEKVTAILEKDAEKLLPRKATHFSAADRLSAIKGNGRKVFIEVKEDIQMPLPDPASEIALKKLLLSLDFQIVKSRSEADFAIICEALASSAGQYHKFNSAQARVELSVYKVKDDKMLAVGARKETLAGATYAIAAKDAINQATLTLAAKVLQCLK